jgi:tRNA U38,U39,U40 pseudouridine synthase TruA
MVRMLVGALIHVGRGSFGAAGIESLLGCMRHPDGRLAKSPLSAEAAGLYLVEVFYPAAGQDGGEPPGQVKSSALR